MAYIQDLKAVGLAFASVAGGQIVSQLTNKVVNNAPLSYALIGALATAGALVSKNYWVKGGLTIAGGAMLWLALEEYLKSKGWYPLQKLQGNVPVVYVQPAQPQKKVEIFSRPNVATY